MHSNLSFHLTTLISWHHLGPFSGFLTCTKASFSVAQCGGIGLRIRCSTKWWKLVSLRQVSTEAAGKESVAPRTPPRLWKKCNKSLEKCCWNAACIFAHGSKQAPHRPRRCDSGCGWDYSITALHVVDFLIFFSDFRACQGVVPRSMLLSTIKKTQWHP